MNISPQSKSAQRGFTLVELMVSMSVTLIIVGVLLAMARVAVSGFRTAQVRTQTSAVAKDVLNTVAKDLEGMVIRTGNPYEWVLVKKSGNSGTELGPEAQKNLSNAMEMSFFSAVTDRYNGDIGGTNDKGGDISLIRYRLIYQDTITASGKYPVFSLYRERIEPDITFRDFLAQDSLDKSSNSIVDRENYLAENIYDFTISFNFEGVDSSGNKIFKRHPIMVDGKFKNLSIKGNEIIITGDSAPLPKARLVSADISIVILSYSGMKGLKNAKINTKDDLAKYIAKHGQHFSKTVTLPRP